MTLKKIKNVVDLKSTPQQKYLKAAGEIMIEEDGREVAPIVLS